MANARSNRATSRWGQWDRNFPLTKLHPPSAFAGKEVVPVGERGGKGGGGEGTG